jgi:molybdenum cofactor guanylyltransferase
MNKVTGYILAGGKSSRMGIDKGLMLIDDVAMVQYVIAKLKPVVDKVVIVSNNPEYKIFGLDVLEDLIKDIGPAGGIYTALNHTNTEKNFVVSCDMPFITSGAVCFMIENSSTSEITLPAYNQMIQPLFGIYSKACLPRWKFLIDQGIIKLHDLIRQFNLKKLNIEKNDLFGEKIFLNLNSKTDFENPFNIKV